VSYRPELLAHIDFAGTELDWVVECFPAGLLHARPGAEWSVHEALVHLRDVEIDCYAPRIAALATADGAFFADYRGDEYHAEHYDPDEPLASVLTSFHEARSRSLDLLRTLGDGQWQRVGQHETMGPMAMGYLVEQLYWHTLEHVTQVVGNRELLAWRS